MNHKDVMHDINKMLEGAEPPITSECCIYKVPFDLRKVNEDAYTPKVVSIGPFHYGNPMLQNMHKYKLIYCNKFIERLNRRRSSLDLNKLVWHIEQAEPSVRRCYSDALGLAPEALVKVILVDSAFIFELFWRYYYGEWSHDDTLFLKPWLTTKIRLDLLLLENQLPFSVLNTLFELAFESNDGIPSFLEFTLDYFKHYNSSELDANIVGNDIKHFTDLLRNFYLKPALPFRGGRKDESMIHLQSATELSEAGVTFKVNTESKCLLDLRFVGRSVLEIPKIRVEDWTETLFRNLMALEQCHYPYNSYFTDYVAVLDFLINTSNDVDVLVDKEILVNWLGDGDSVAKLFNSLWKNITNVNFGKHYFDLCRDLDAFYRDPVHNLHATLWRDYGSTPWQAAATIGGILLLFLSLLQSVCSVIQVVQQAKPK